MSLRRLRMVFTAWILVSMAFAQALFPGGSVPEAQAATIFYLPWEAGSVWQITNGNGTGEHADAANLYGFDAAPDSGRSTNHVTAIAAGQVLGFQNDVPNEPRTAGPHAGNCMLIQHADGSVSIYAHLAAGSIPGELLREGAEVRGGMVIGTVGKSGYAFGEHLHWSLLSEGHMYDQYGYRTCKGPSIPSTYADNDRELIEDGGVPQTWRYYESTNVDGGTTQAPPAPTAAAAPVDDSSGSVPMVIGAVGPNGNEIGAQITVTTDDGEIVGSCTVEGSRDAPYIEACVVNVPDNLTVVVVTLDVSTVSQGYSPEENPIIFDTSRVGQASHDVVFQNVPQSGVISSNQSSDVAIVTTENGQPVYDACFVLVDFGNEGCDRNSDGQITFEDVPLGTYTLRQTGNLGSGRSVPDSTITIAGAADSDGWERFSAEIVASSGSSSNSVSSDKSGAVDIALITRDPDDGHLLSGTCYVLVGYSNEGCDENGDGQVTFAAIPYGTYTVRQTQAPSGYPTINDYDINVQPAGYYEGPTFGVPLGFIVRQAPEQNAPNTRNVSVIMVDNVTQQKLPGLCVEVVGASSVGCDEDLLDGQIDFLDVPAGGPYELSFPNLPAGYKIVTVPGTQMVQIDAGPGEFANRTVFVMVLVPESATAPIEPSDTSVSSSSTGATMLMTFRACPEGFNPNTDDFFSDCTIPLDAPDAAFYYHGGDGQGGSSIIWLDRQYNGEYVYNAGPQTMNVELSGLAPVLRDEYQVFGFDGVNGDTYTFNLTDGETREVFIFYYYS